MKYLIVPSLLAVCLTLTQLLQAQSPQRPSDENSKGRVSAQAVIQAIASGEEDSPARHGQAVGSEIRTDLVEGEFGRIVAVRAQLYRIRIDLANHDPEKPVEVRADWGGVINGSQGPLRQSRMASPTLEFEFGIGSDHGRYPITIEHNGERQLLEFWVGPQPETGKPGPTRTFSAPKSLPSENR